MFVCTNRRSFLVGMAAATAVSCARAAGPSAAERMNAANKHLLGIESARAAASASQRAPIIAAVYYTNRRRRWTRATPSTRTSGR